MALQFKQASRKSVPLLISVSSVSGGGKTFSSLLLAAGIAGAGGRVGFIDTENGRGEMYADSPGIMAALPSGYEYIRMDPPFSPERYVEHIQAAEQAGINVCVIDSFTHEWEGIGGCCEIAEKQKLGGMPNWAKAKILHKRLVNHLLTSPMHIIFCIRGREKVKVFKKGDQIVTGIAAPGEQYPIAEKDSIVSLGVQPVTEKNFVFEMLVSLYLDEHTHSAFPTKVPQPLAHLFQGKGLLSKEDGARIREWNELGASAGEHEQLQKRARAAAEDGMAAYTAFFGGLSAQQKKVLAASSHTENKRIADKADMEVAEAEAGAAPVFRDLGSVDSLPDPIDYPANTHATCGGKTWAVQDTDQGPKWAHFTASVAA